MQVFRILSCCKPSFQTQGTNLAGPLEFNLHRFAFHDIMIELIVPPFYPVLDTGLLSRLGIPTVDAAEAILEGGARILQLRHKGHYSRKAFDEARQIAELCQEALALFVVNDRADIAAMLRAGVHLGQDDLPPRYARRVLPPHNPLGLSTHNEDQLRAALNGPADYVAIGPIFNTRSKENPDPVVGLEELSRLRGISDKPMVAIGGITRAFAIPVLDAGADSVAVIRDLFPMESSKHALRTRTEEWVQLLKRNRSKIS